MLTKKIYNYFYNNSENTQIYNKNIFTYTLYYIFDFVDNKPIYDEYIVIQK